MTTAREFSKEIGVPRGLIHLAIGTSKKAGIWPGEDIKEKVTILQSDGRVTRRLARILTEDQKSTIEDELVRMGENEKAWNKELIKFSRTRKEQMSGSALPEGACSPRGQERDWPPHPIV